MKIFKANDFRTRRSCFELTPNYSTATKATDCTFKTIKSNNFNIHILKTVMFIFLRQYIKVNFSIFIIFRSISMINCFKMFLFKLVSSQMGVSTIPSFQIFGKTNEACFFSYRSSSKIAGVLPVVVGGIFLSY